MKDLLIEGKIVIFKSLANCASGFDKDCAIFAVEQLSIIKRTLFGKEKNPK